MTYIELIRDERFDFLLNKYMKHDNSEIDYKKYFEHFLENMNSEELIIPVLGVQGAGKSSFINSLLMKENILPTDVDETTCVPVEVRYGTNLDKVILYFKDDEKEEISVENLYKYVHNDYNPANELGVKKIVLFNDSDILKQNIVIVDLPGVGSLTPENQKTTLDYVNKLVSGIFMVRTNPPITRSEKNFINALWPKLSNVLFVQNKWNDESYEDANEAKEHNEYVLSKISKDYNESRYINVDIVNVYEAVKGKFTNDMELYKNSGIINVIENIKSIAINHNNDTEEMLNNKLIDVLQNIEDSIQTSMKLALDQNLQSQELKDEKIDNIKNILSENKKKFRKIRRYAYDEMDTIIDYTSKVINYNIDYLRSKLKSIINKGIVDGEILSSIYKENSDKVINNIMDEVLIHTTELIKSLNIQLDNITIKGFNGAYENISFFNKQSSFKFENSIPSILGLSSGVIGTVGTIGSLGGPLGVLVGMGIGLAFSIIGDSIRRGILKKRANYTIKDLEPMIQDFEKYLKEEILDDLKAKQEEVLNSIISLKSNIEHSLKLDIQKIIEQYEKHYDQNNILEFEEDLKLLNELKNQLT